MQRSDADRLILRATPQRERRQVIQWWLDAGADRQALPASPFATLPHEEETLWGRLFEARRSARTVGAVAARGFVDGTAQVLVPRLAAEEPEETARLLLGRVQAWLRGERVTLAVSFVRPQDAAATRWFRQAGYERSDDLLVLAGATDSACDPPESGGLEFEQYGSEQAADLAELVRATLIDSRDFPALRTPLSPAALLPRWAENSAGGADWQVVRHGAQAVGCLLLADHPARDRCELLYMGLVPRWRGRGWGRRLARQALWTAGRRGRRELVLGVAAGNDPAIAAYAAAGLWQADRQAVLAWTAPATARLRR
jgi:ribosomal protein S18 acetylase RimI-like enzyme